MQRTLFNCRWSCVFGKMPSFLFLRSWMWVTLCSKWVLTKTSELDWKRVAKTQSELKFYNSSHLQVYTILVEEDFTQLVPCLVPRRQLQYCWNRILHTWYPASSPVGSYSIAGRGYYTAGTLPRPPSAAVSEWRCICVFVQSTLCVRDACKWFVPWCHPMKC